MRGRGSDLGGRWPVGLWLALVGMSAGTVASFGMVGWTFAMGLYGEEEAGPPLAFDSESVVIEAEEPPGDDGPEGDGSDGGSSGTGVDLGDLELPVDPGGETANEPEPVEPQVSLVPVETEDARVEERAPVEESAPIEEAEPPKLVPVEESESEPEDDCDREEHEGGSWEHGWDDAWEGGWNGDWDKGWGGAWKEDREQWARDREDAYGRERDRHADEAEALLEAAEEIARDHLD